MDIFQDCCYYIYHHIFAQVTAVSKQYASMYFSTYKMHFQKTVLLTNAFFLFPQDFISKLPGINTSNIYSVLNKVSSLPELLTLSKENLTEILGSSNNAEALYSSLHQCMKPPEQPQDARRGGRFTKKGQRRFQTRVTR